MSGRSHPPARLDCAFFAGWEKLLLVVLTWLGRIEIVAASSASVIREAGGLLAKALTDADAAREDTFGAARRAVPPPDEWDTRDETLTLFD